MHWIKRILIVLLVLLLLSAVAGGLVWNMRNYIMIDFRFYPRNVAELDLRGEKISVRQYERICRRLPECDIRWSVPLSEGRYDETVEHLTISGLTDSDVRNMDYLTQLKSVQAEGCTDYTQLLALQQRRPEVDVSYSVAVGENWFHCSLSRIEMAAAAEEHLNSLAWLPNLQTVICTGGTQEEIFLLRDYCSVNNLGFGLKIAGKTVLDTDKTVTLTAVEEEDLKLLPLLSGLETLKLKKPEASADSLMQLREDLPGVDISWDAVVCGEIYSTDTTELDLSEETVISLGRLQQELSYFPKLETVFLGECGFENEDLAAFREEMRENYKVVWTVQLGKKLKARTDDTTFMPVREHVYYFNDEEAYNLRYCEEMVCIDIGHMSITDIEFVEFMPNLEFLILAHTQVQYIEPIRTCKKLKFLELDWSPIKDYSPLTDCTALEDLNIGNTYANSDPIGTMSWLKNLWMVGCSTGARYRMTQALPDTKVMVTGAATVANGWRNLDNYYEMRDLLGMHYMSW